MNTSHTTQRVIIGLLAVLILCLFTAIVTMLAINATKAAAPPPILTTVAPAYIRPIQWATSTTAPDESIVYAAEQVDFVPNTLRCRDDTIGDAVISGKVKNIGSRDLQFVELRGTIYDSAGNIINNETTYIDSDVLYAGSTSTYSVYVNDPGRQLVRCEIQVEDARFK